MKIWLKQNLKSIIIKIGFYLNKDLIESRSPVGLYRQDSIEKSYNFFKKYFNSSILFSSVEGIRKYCILKVLEYIKVDDLILEFGVYSGESINFFSKIILKNNISNKIYGFDSFEGLSDDWVGNIDHPQKIFDLKKKLPRINSNIELIQGRVEDTVDKFLNKRKGNIIFVHFDLDLYLPTKIVLEKIKKRLSKDSVLLFDQ
ncbi:class I SAM-dependent methyltransferase, partial [Alphaproteobacteria bacterium]|nr:class I SAM-dependent methyltransferase [Alphaproteobacteria bacterium]